MTLEVLTENAELPAPRVKKEHSSLDPDHYRARMLPYISAELEENRIFYEALEFANKLHAGQKRKSGAPYISHPLGVAEILLRELRLRDPRILAAALLHDVVEDVPLVGIEDIERRFGDIVAELVDGCTKLTRQHLDRAISKDLTHSKIFLSASRRLGVLIIKLADRLHNLRTLHYLPKSKRQRIAQETLDVYAPIAAKLNIFPLKRELYHLALSYFYPKKSKKILQFIRGFRNSPEVLEFESRLHKAFADAGRAVTIRSRPKGLGSYYDPLKRTLELANAENHMDFAIILDSEDLIQCYVTLGIVNSTFTPIPRSLRDFISNPKMTGYSSLHVRVHVGGENYLIKIRTPKMDEYATYGILTKWDMQTAMSDEHWQEVRELLRSIGEYGGAAPKRKALIRLSEAEEIFVYSPKGDIYYLPKGSIVLDFAYRIHSELGDHCEGAMVNGVWVQATHPLSDGDVVKILTSPDLLEVDPDLEDLCKTPKARTAINKLLQQKRLRYAREIGRQILLQEVKRHGLSPEILEGENTKLILEFHNIKDLTDLYVRVGQDLLSPHVVLYYFTSPRFREKEKPLKTSSSCPYPHDRNVLQVKDLDRAIHKFARCCHPLPAQENLLAVLSERGITFHQRECTELHERHDLHPQSLLEVHWERETDWRYPLFFKVRVLENSVLSLIRSLSCRLPDVQIQNMAESTDKHDRPYVVLNVKLRNFREAERFFQCLPAGLIIVESYGRGEGPRNLVKS